MRSHPAIIAIIGPTGVGKSGLALKLARRLQGHILCADSRQVYRYLDIGTEKPTPAEQSMAPHHLLDLVDPDQRFSVVEFAQRARTVLDEMGPEDVAIIAGGSGYYVRSLLEGRTYPVPESDSHEVDAIEARLRISGMPEAVAEIQAIDASTAARLDGANPRRVARALHIIRMTGRPIDAVETRPLPAVVIGLQQDRTKLYARLDQRVDHQISAGLVEETKSILERGFSKDLPVLNGLAYGEMLKYIDGHWSLEEARIAYKHATHGLVRNQLTWFRKEPRITWLDVDDVGFPATAFDMAERYVAELEKPSAAVIVK
jgi:tRNA dimethylallyltransferase